MTEAEIEKQAEEYIINKYYRDWLEEESRDVILEDVYAHDKNELQAFQAGAKWGAEHAIEWHDLQKDPNDLPKETGRYYTDDGSIYIYDTDYKKWREPTCMYCWDFNWLDDGDVIAWCELPQFKDKE